MEKAILHDVIDQNLLNIIEFFDDIPDFVLQFDAVKNNAWLTVEFGFSSKYDLEEQPMGKDPLPSNINWLSITQKKNLKSIALVLLVPFSIQIITNSEVFLSSR